MRIELGSQRTLFIHLTLVPFISAVGEIKTKPTQHSVKELRSIGVQPDVLICRMEQPLPDNERKKLALFTNVQESAIISAVNVDNIYKVPKLFNDQNLDQIVVDKLGLNVGQADLSEWNAVVESMEHPQYEVNIAMVGKYMDLTDSYKSLSEALIHGGIHSRTRTNILYIDSEEIERSGTGLLNGMDSEKEVSKARYKLSVMPEKIKFHTWEFVWVCMSPSLSLPEMWRVLRRLIVLNLIKIPHIL
jgi:CTP synthase